MKNYHGLSEEKAYLLSKNKGNFKFNVDKPSAKKDTKTRMEVGGAEDHSDRTSLLKGSGKTGNEEEKQPVLNQSPSQASKSEDELLKVQEVIQQKRKDADLNEELMASNI